MAHKDSRDDQLIRSSALITNFNNIYQTPLNFTRTPNINPPQQPAKQLEKKQLIKLLTLLVSSPSEEDEILLSHPRLWTEEQYETALCINHSLALHSCREWQQLYVRPRSDNVKISPPLKPAILKDIYGNPLSYSMAMFAKTIAKRVLTEGNEKTIISLKTGLNFLPAQLGCRKPNLEATSNFDAETKRVLVENMLKRGKHAIEEAFAMGLLTIALTQDDEKLDKDRLQFLAGNYIAPLFLEKSTNTKALWTAAIHKLVGDESNSQIHGIPTITHTARELNIQTLSEINAIINAKGVNFFVEKFAQNMGFFKQP